MRTDIKRTTMNITTYCNLKCKHCLAFIPYYKDPSHVSFEEAEKVLKTYFQVVDSVEHFTITGGEPLLNKEAYNILQEVFRYQDQVKGSIDFVTNATIEIPDHILDLFAEHQEHTKIVLSDYGQQLSKKTEVIQNALENNRGKRKECTEMYTEDWEILCHI